MFGRASPRAGMRLPFARESEPVTQQPPVRD
jgi:hypothetical protein